MGLEYLGELDGVDGVAERDGRVVAEVELRDGRKRHYIETSGTAEKTPGHVSGFVSIRFSMTADPELDRHLRDQIDCKRITAPYEFDIVVSEGRRIGPSSVAGPQGMSTEDPGGYWFTLEF